MVLGRVVLKDADTPEWLCFDEPVEVLVARTPEEVRRVLQRVQSAVDSHNFTAAGYVAYEAAPAFDRSFRTRPVGRLPPAVFGLYRAPRRAGILPAPSDSRPEFVWRPTTAKDRYVRCVDAIRAQIERGNCYQVNYTIRLAAEGVDDAFRLFGQIAGRARFGAYLDVGDLAIVSASPELFFTLDGARVACRPMKGTARRGLTAEADDQIADVLRSSEKNRAENIMIADMVRNDLGRIAFPGSVRALSLYELEKYPTVWQMTSTVEARTSASLDELFAALFPCASVTGAPKTAAMALVAELEDSPRDIYTGAIGWIGPGPRACFSVAIRTALVETATKRATYGAGGGIVWDSDPFDEYRECLAKTRVLDTPDVSADSFDLIETLRWSPSDGYFLREFHLERLLASARYFDFAIRRSEVVEALDDAVKAAASATRVRLLASAGGRIRTETGVLPDDSGHELRLRLARFPVDDQDPFLYHKTTRRHAYDTAAAGVNDCDDVLLWNRAGFLTESTRSNVIVRLRGRDFTPPVSSGLLAGTYRRWLFANTDLVEREIRLDDLGDAEAIVLVNSVRGRQPARLVGSGRGE
jgi:para-aminobenzoate synthetase/4-amino-4-deoxychorismate lyase